MTEVKRYDVMACIGTPARTWHSVVLASDYDALAAELAEAKHRVAAWSGYSDELERVKADHSRALLGMMSARDDRDRLRAALERIERYDHIAWDAQSVITDIIAIAREALRGADQPAVPPLAPPEDYIRGFSDGVDAQANFCKEKTGCQRATVQTPASLSKELRDRGLGFPVTAPACQYCGKIIGPQHVCPEMNGEPRAAAQQKEPQS